MPVGVAGNNRSIGKVDTGLTGGVAVVLGGTSGIGRAAALIYAVHGAAVVFQGRNRDAAEAVIASAVEAGAPVAPIFVSADLYDYDEVANVMATANEYFGRLDVLFASGGTSRPKAKLFQEMEKEEIKLYFQSRAFHRVNAIHGALPYMRKQRYGKIISLVTDAGRMPT